MHGTKARNNRINDLFTFFSFLTLSIMFKTIRFRFHSFLTSHMFLPFSLSYPFHSLNLKEILKKDEIKRIERIEDTKILRLYVPASFLRKFSSFSQTALPVPLFVTVLLSVNRNFSPSAIPRSSSLGHSRLSSRAKIHAPARAIFRLYHSFAAASPSPLPPDFSRPSTPFHPPYRGDRGAELDK